MKLDNIILFFLLLMSGYYVYNKYQKTKIKDVIIEDFSSQVKKTFKNTENTENLNEKDIDDFEATDLFEDDDDDDLVKEKIVKKTIPESQKKENNNNNDDDDDDEDDDDWFL